MNALRTLTRPLLRQLGHQHWLPFGLRDRIIRWVVPPGSAAPFEVGFYGRRYSGNLRSFIDWSVYFYGAYERGELLFFGDLLRALGPQSTALDIGANVGHHSLFLSQFAAQVHSFEPWAVAANEVERRIRENNLTHVTLHRVALGDRNEERTFYAPNSENMGTGSFHQENSSSNAPLGSLPIRRGDDYLRESGVDRVDFVKMDVEGHEIHALDGLRETLEQHRPILVMEFSPMTAASLGAGHLLDHLPQDYVALYLDATTGSYVLRPYAPRVETSNVVLAPREKEHLLPRSRVELMEGSGPAAATVNAVADMFGR